MPHDPKGGPDQRADRFGKQFAPFRLDLGTSFLLTASSMAMLMAAQGHAPVLGFKMLGASAVALAISVGEGSSIPGHILQSLRAPLELLHIRLCGEDRSEHEVSCPVS